MNVDGAPGLVGDLRLSEFQEYKDAVVYYDEKTGDRYVVHPNARFSDAASLREQALKIPYAGQQRYCAKE